MATHKIKIIDALHNVIAAGEVVENGDRFAGRIDLSVTPPRIQKLFAEYQETVNGQMFSLLDEVGQKITDLELRVQFEDGRVNAIADLQVYPASSRMSFSIMAASERVGIPAPSDDPVQIRQ